MKDFSLDAEVKVVDSLRLHPANPLGWNSIIWICTDCPESPGVCREAHLQTPSGGEEKKEVQNKER